MSIAEEYFSKKTIVWWIIFFITLITLGFMYWQIWKLEQFQLAIGYVEVAEEYQERGNLAKAKEMHIQALDIFQKLGNQQAQMVVYGKIGFIYIHQKDFQAAEKMCHKSLELYLQIDNKENLDNQYLSGMEKLYMTLATHYQVNGNLRKTKKMYLKTVEIFQILGNKQAQMASLYEKITLISAQQKDFQTAEKMCHKSLELYQEIDDQAGIAGQYFNLGKLYAVQGIICNVKR